MSQSTQFVDLDGNKYYDEVESVVTEHGSSYRTIQMSTFASLNTTPSDWSPCAILDILTDPMDGSEIIQWDLPSDYTEVPHSRFNEGFGSRCQLCGHGIKRLFFIQCNSKKLYLQVGSECVNTYHGAHFTDKMIRTFKDNRTRQLYRAWRDTAIAEIESKRSPARGLYSVGFLPEPYWSLNKRILKVDPTKSTSRVLANLMKKGNKILFNKEMIQ